MTKLLTSSWFSPRPDGHVRVGISRRTPRGMPAGYRRYPKLAPGPWFASVSPLEYQRLYQDEILSRLDPQRVVDELVQFADGQVPVLCCYERSDTPAEKDWCHRGLVSVWLKETINLDVFELGRESCGCGYQHPKLHPTQARRSES